MCITRHHLWKAPHILLSGFLFLPISRFHGVAVFGDRGWFTDDLCPHFLKLPERRCFSSCGMSDMSMSLAGLKISNQITAAMAVQ